MPIISFADPALEDFWHGVKSARARAIPADVQRRLLVRLTALDVAAALSDLAVPPSNNLEPLSGDLAGHWSIRVNKQWRLVFRWLDGAAGPSDVRFVDYH